MKIIRVLNNSAVISENQEHEEIIALGKGIAYGKIFSQAGTGKSDGKADHTGAGASRIPEGK